MPVVHHRRAATWVLVLLLALVLAAAAAPAALGLTSMESLGKKLFFDSRLSYPDGQACADCHHPTAGWADPMQSSPVSEGVITGRLGNRNSPAAAYAKYSPTFRYDSMHGRYVGGQFWDGRAADLVAQAKGPFLNPLEMNNPSQAAVVNDVRTGTYASHFKQVFGSGAFSSTSTAYHNIAVAIAAYEKSSELNRFSSKYDAVMAGRATFTTQEQQGMQLFRGKGNCSSCHGGCGMGGGGMGGGGMGGGGCGGGGCGGMSTAAFSDFTYRNLGVPRNPALPFYTELEFNPAGAEWVDLGLGGVLNDRAQDGKMRVPPLRNVALTAPYTHNGSFTTLKEVVHFYNTRDTGAWPAPEVPRNVSTLLGNLGLTGAEEDAIVAFLRTLSDQ
jgi:cytochrome c peroxidase